MDRACGIWVSIPILAAEADQPESAFMRENALSVIVTGSSAAIGITSHLMWLRQEIDLPLRVLLTHSSERFVRREAVGWYADELFTSDDPSLNPAEFARRSLGILVLPASANTLACAALGLAGSPAQTALLSSIHPVLFFPSMNSVMWQRRTTQAHVATLRADGHTVVEPAERAVFELWQRENVIGPVMPAPDEAAKLAVDYLEAILDADPDKSIESIEPESD